MALEHSTAMNPPAMISPSTPALRLPSRADSSAGGTGSAKPATSQPFDPDGEGFREREANLRAYEARLRAWQAQLDARAGGAVGSAGPFARPSSRTPFAGDTELEAAWGKLHRTHALMEAEQNQLRDERMALHATEQMIKQREADLATREARLAECERSHAGTTRPEASKSARKSPSAVERFTAAPFRAARAVFKSAS